MQTRFSKIRLSCAIRSVALPFLVSVVALAQPEPDQRVLNNNTYVRESGNWYLLEPDGDRFPVDMSVITVRFRDDVPETAAGDLHDQLQAKVVRKARTGFIDIEVNPAMGVFGTAEAYYASGLVRDAEVNTFGFYTIVPDDTSYGSQWHHPVIQTDMAWDTVTGLPEVIVGILDSGTEFSHNDMGMGGDAYQNVYLNPGEDAWTSPNNPGTGNGVDDDMNGLVDDWKGWDFPNDNNDSSGPFNHGTLVGGLVSAKTNNGFGVAGVAGGFGNEGVKLLICGVGDSAPSGAILDDAILYSAEMGARIIQMSLTVGQSAAIDAALQSAYENDGVFIACASGNAGATSVSYPSVNGFVMAVGSTTQSDFRSSFSNHGPDLEISSPGSNITSTDTGSGVTSSSGTSFASPILSGVAALMFSVNPALTNDNVRDLLKMTADKVGGYDYNWNAGMPGHSFELGYGRVNALAAVTAAGGGIADLFIKDSPEDVGNEPNTESGDDVWASIDIWNCVDDPDCTDHEEPQFKMAGDNYLRIEVRNRGTLTSPNANLHLYWSRVRTDAQWPDHWLHPSDPNNPGSNMINGNPGGGEITVVDEVGFSPDPLAIPPIPPSGSVMLTRAWQPPDRSMLLFGLPGGEDPALGILARILAASDPMNDEAAGDTKPNVVRNNNIATKNGYAVDLYPCNPDSERVTTLAFNPDGTATDYDFFLTQLSAAFNGVGFNGEIVLTLSQDLWDDWVAAGQMGANITPLPNNQVAVVDPDSDASLLDIPIAAGDAQAIGIEFMLLSSEGVGGNQFNYMLTQVRSSDSEVVGGAVYDVEILDLTLSNQLPLWPDPVTVVDLVPLACGIEF